MSARSRSPFDPFRLTENGLWLRDNTIANVSASRHGFAPKLPNDATKYLDGTGAWSTPAGGGGSALVFLERHVASNSAQLDFTAFISGTYDKYLIVGESLVAGTSGADLYMRVGAGGGPTYDTGNNYEYGRIGIKLSSPGSTSNVGVGAVGQMKVFEGMGTTAGWAGDFRLTVTSLQSTSLRKSFFGDGRYIDSSPAAVMMSWEGQWNNTGTAATALRFLMSSGNIASGSITIYGMANS